MRLKEARVQKYRSIHDSGWFEIDANKAILVGPNEAGKTALLQALQHLNPPKGTKGFDALRDYPRAEYNDITTSKVNPATIKVVEGRFILEDKDKELIPEEFHNCTYLLWRNLDNKVFHKLENAPARPTYATLKKDLLRMAAHMDLQADPEAKPISQALTKVTTGWTDNDYIAADKAEKLSTWLDQNIQYVDESNNTEEARYDKISKSLANTKKHNEVLEILCERSPVFVLFSNYFRVRPLIHLEHLATRLESGVLDDDYYDYGNKCLLQLLGFSARELSNLGKAKEPPVNDPDALQKYRDQLDKRSYQLNAASVRLTREIQNVWAPDSGRDEADRLRVSADGQYLKVVVEDDLGVEIELDQRSEGFQWLVSFFVVFFAEAADKHQNAILLLDEPGLSLHGLKQREFRKTISRLAISNQTLYSTHSPFLVGPNELDIVKVVEMTDRSVGTKVHTTVTASDAAGLLPLQEALGYDLAQSLFGQQRNLVLEGLTDYWYVDAMSELLNLDGSEGIKKNVALVPASSASKVVYFATILHAQNLKVAALLDSDAAGESAANQDTLVHTLGQKAILRTKDVYTGSVGKPEVEDLLRSTLVTIAKAELSWDVEAKANAQSSRPIVDIFVDEIPGFSKYRLAKCFLRWSRTSTKADFKTDEIDSWKKLFVSVNKALK